MEEKTFQDYYNQVRERDEKIAEMQPLPSAEGVNAWVVLGLSLGIASIAFSFITIYSIVLAFIALIFSFIGYRLKNNNVAIAGLVCSILGLIMGIAFALIRHNILESINSTWQNIINSFPQ